MLLEELLEVHAADKLHHHEVLAADLAQVIGLNDVGMDQVGDQFRFADEIFDEGFLVGVALADDFDGDALDEVARAVLFGFVNDAHAAFKDFSNNLVAELTLNREQAAHPRMLCQWSVKSSLRSAPGGAPQA